MKNKEVKLTQRDLQDLAEEELKELEERKLIKRDKQGRPIPSDELKEK